MAADVMNRTQNGRMEKEEPEGAVSRRHENSERRGLSGSTLKLIAVISMLIDHTGAVLLARLLIQFRGLDSLIAWDDFFRYFPWVSDYDTLYNVYQIMRDIGRIAFPIYCFLLVEGFEKTRSRKRYALRLAVFALVSEIPFDLAFSATVLEFSYQNVFFTLALGLFAMMACEAAKTWGKIRNFAASGFLCAGIFMVFAAAAEYLQTDYGATGVICIMVLYLLRDRKVLQLLGGALSFCWEIPAPLAFVPLACYNGKRGLRLKYFFYLFYPLHLLLLYLTGMWLGIGNIPVV